MEIFIPADSHSIAEANVWINRHNNAETLIDLEASILEFEKNYGHCSVLVEFSLLPRNEPEGSKQIDLVVAFDERVALCEIKGTTNPSRYVEDSENQVSKQAEVLKKLLSAQGNFNDSVRQFLWLTVANKSELRKHDALARSLTKHHVNTVGNKANSLEDDRSIYLVDNRPAYFPDALKPALTSLRPRKNYVRISSALVEHVRETYLSANIELQSFSSFKKLSQYVRTADIDTTRRLHPEYVWYTRPKELSDAQEIIRNTNLLEVNGSSGIGKTTFTKEILNRCFQQKRLSQPQVVMGTSKLRDLLAQLAIQAVGFEPDQILGMHDDDLVTKLCQFDVVFWIRDYAFESLPAVEQLLGKLRKKAASGSAAWIVESMTSDFSVRGGTRNPHLINLQRLTDEHIRELLSNYEQVNFNVDLLTVIAECRGNPEIAIQLWTTQSVAPLKPRERLTPYDHVFSVLTREQREYLGPLAYLLREAPLGCTVRMASTWCHACKPHGNVEQIVSDLVSICSRLGFLDIDYIGNLRKPQDQIAVSSIELRDIERALISVVPQEAAVGIIRIVDPHFVDHCLKALAGRERSDNVRERIAEALLEGTIEEGTLSAVTVSLLIADFSPFLLSSFRLDNDDLRRVGDWIERSSSSAGPSMRSAYLLEFVSWSLEHHWNISEVGDHPVWPLSPPKDNDEVQILAKQISLLKGLSHFSDTGYNFADWDRIAEDHRTRKEYDLWAEAKVRRAQATQSAPTNDIRKAWNLYGEVFESFDLLTPLFGQAYAHYSFLSLLNKGHRITDEVPEASANRNSLIESHLRKLLELGLRAENINYVANAIFYAVRRRYDASESLSEDDVNVMVRLLRFVSKHSPRRRVQAALTESSIHRKFAKQHTHDWETFRIHAEVSLKLLDDVIQGADQRGMSSQVLDCLSYGSELSIKTIQHFRGVGVVYSWLARVSARTLINNLQFAQQNLGKMERDGEYSYHLISAKNRFLLTAITSTIDRGQFVGALAGEVSHFSGEFSAAHRRMSRKQWGKAVGRVLREFVYVFDGLRRHANFANHARTNMAELTNVLRCLDAGAFSTEHKKLLARFAATFHG